MLTIFRTNLSLRIEWHINSSFNFQSIWIFINRKRTCVNTESNIIEWDVLSPYLFDFLLCRIICLNQRWTTRGATPPRSAAERWQGTARFGSFPAFWGNYVFFQNIDKFTKNEWLLLGFLYLEIVYMYFIYYTRCHAIEILVVTYFKDEQSI
jgi:hypothetical protein